MHTPQVARSFLLEPLGHKITLTSDCLQSLKHKMGPRFTFSNAQGRRSLLQHPKVTGRV